MDQVKWITPKIIGIFVVTFCSIVLFTFWFECEAVKINSTDLAKISYRAMEEACDYMSKESYRGSTVGATNYGGGSRNLAYNLKGFDGSSVVSVVSGDFYKDEFGYVKQDEIYTAIFSNSSSTNPMDYMKHLNSIISPEVQKNSTYKGLNNIMINEASEEFSVYVTPSNLGYTYLDSRLLNRVFNWKMANILSAAAIYGKDYKTRRNILKDEDGDWYVKWRGFRIYLKDSNGSLMSYVKIDPATDIQVLDLRYPDDVYVFEDYTGIIVDNYINKNAIDNSPTSDDPRIYKIMYRVRWHLSIAYEGILPIRLINEFFDGDTPTSFSVGEYNPLVLNFHNPINVQNTTNRAAVTNGSDHNEIFGDKIIVESDKDDTKKYHGFQVTESDGLSQSDINTSVYGIHKSEKMKNKFVGVGQSFYYILVN